MGWVRMFYGTRFGYNLLYFLTAMSPAYVLFLLQIDNIFHSPLDKNILGIRFNIYTWCLVLIIVFIILGFLLKGLLKLQLKRGTGTPVLEANLKKFYKSNIEEVNGNIISFLLGNIIPVVLIMENSITVAIAVFVVLQIFIYTLTIKSSDIFPNVLLIILGVDICKTKDGNYLLIFKGQDKNLKEVYQLGDAGRSKLYITAYKK